MTLRIVGMIPSVVAGYFLTVAIETPVLVMALQKKYSLKQKVLAGFALTGFSYPFVCFVFPHLFPVYEPGSIYLWVAESFAPISECFVFWLLFSKCAPLRDATNCKDLLSIVVANLLSFAVGEWLKQSHLIEFIW
jgi:hypothetical protein